jgi:hypothetical protein
MFSRRSLLAFVLAFVLALLLSFAASRPARACAVCATADPSLAAPRAEQPFAGRLRAATDLRAGSVDAAGASGAPMSVADRRLVVSASYAPAADVMLSLAVPALQRDIASPAGTVSRASLGDVETRVALVRASPYALVRTRLALFGGVDAPSAPVERDAGGAVLPAVLQPGCSSVVSVAGVVATLARSPWTWSTTAALFLPFSVRDAPHAGDSLRGGTSLQWQPLASFAARAGTQARLESAGQTASGEGDPNSGGFIAYASADLLLSPASDLVFTFGGLAPVAQVFHGRRHEGPVLAFGAAYDF